MFNYAKRLNRVSYLASIVVAYVGLIFVAIAQALLEGANEDFWGNNGSVNLMIGIFIITGLAVFFLYILGITRQRANDIGWHPLLVAVFSFCSPLMLVLLIIPGAKQANKFGRVPKSGLHLR